MVTNEACETMQAGMTECIICVNDVQGTVSINCFGGTVNHPPDTNGNNNNNNNNNDNNNDNNNNNNQTSTQSTVVDGNPITQPTVLSIPTAPVVNFSWREYANNEVDFFWDVDFSQSLSCDFGEGAGDLPLPLGKAPMTHKFATAATFSVVLTDHYATSYTKSLTKSVTTNGRATAASFAFNVGGLTIFLRNTSTVRGQAVWNFSDGTLLTGEKVYKKFPSVGLYSITLTVGAFTITQSVEIRPAIVLVWTEDSTSQTGWLIENSLDGGATWTTVKTLSDGTLRTTNCDSSDGVDIFAYQLFRVTALADPTNSDPSNELGQECARI